MIILAVASAGIAAYILPFGSASVTETQGKQSLYEDLHDSTNGIQSGVDRTLDNLMDRFDGIPRAQERTDDGQERADKRFDDAGDKVNDAIGFDTNSIKTDSEEDEESTTETSIAESMDGTDTNSNNNNENNDNDNDDSSSRVRGSLRN